MKRALFALLLFATQAMAEDKPNLDPTAPAAPGAVALYLSATALYDQGVAAKDPLMVLTAARMMQGVTLTLEHRTRDAQTDVPAALVRGPNPYAMFDKARELDSGDNFSDLIEIISRETPPSPRSVRATPSRLDPGAAETWTLQFYGGTYAEVGIEGARTGNLDLAVSDANGTPICTDNGAADTAYCGFVPMENGDFLVTVTNPGTTADGYTLITN